MEPKKPYYKPINKSTQIYPTENTMKSKSRNTAAVRVFRKSEVARMLGVAPQTLMRWMAHPSRELHRRLADAMLPRASDDELVLFVAADIRALLKMEEAANV